MNESNERLVFMPDQVRRWADFSGDFNPIHFQASHALRAGLPSVVAHGMLALIPVKCADSIRTHSHLSDEDRQFKAYFKKPIPLGVPFFLRIDELHDSLQFKVGSESKPEDLPVDAYIRGSYTAAKRRSDRAAIDIDAPEHQWLEIGPDTLRDKAEQYIQICNAKKTPLWAFIGSLVFSEYLRTALDLDVTRWLGSSGTCADEDVHDTNRTWVDRKDVAVMQTAFSLRHNARTRSSLFDEMDRIPAIRWRRSSISAVKKQDETMGSVSLLVEVTPDTHHPDIEIELALIAKKIT